MDELDFETTVKPDWVVKEHVIGSPSTADGMVASYVLDDGNLAIAVWDEETGEELWRDDASTGAGAAGIAMSAHAFTISQDSYLTYLAPKAGGTWQYLVVADLATGERERVINSAVYALERPSLCDDEETICLTAYESDTQNYTSLRYKIGSERIRAAKEEKEGGIRADGYRMIGSHVYSTNSRGTGDEKPEQLGYLEDGKETWHRPYTDVFGKNYSSDGGWVWVDDAETDYVIGTGAYFDPALRDATTGQRFNSDLTQQKIVALDRSSGETAWTVDGGGSCPFKSLDVIGEDDDAVLVACRWNDGSITAKWKSGEFEYIDKPDVDLLGVDPVTGKEVWTLPLGAVEDKSDSTSFVNGDDHLILDIQGQNVAVDLATGGTEEIPAGTYLCEKARWFDAPDPAQFGKTTDFLGGDARFPCDEAGAMLKTEALSVAALTLADGEEGEDVLVSGTNQMARYTVPEKVTWTDRLRDLW